MDTITAHFPELSDTQRQQFAQLDVLYREWNQKINVISRKDIDQLYPHHILHSMLLAKVIRFKAAAHVLDLGTGGGLPGVPLAILFPDTRFTLIDGTKKKLTVVADICEKLQLNNTQVKHVRAEELKQKFDFVVCRAVASIDKLVTWSQPLIKHKQQHALPNGLITLKGGQVEGELKSLPKGYYTECYPLSDYTDIPYYQEKYAVYVQL